eukprot:Selendium_serpulae@DN3416_c0_g1_i1.p1
MGDTRTDTPLCDVTKTKRYLDLYITGFGPFHGVEDNPTTRLCTTIAASCLDLENCSSGTTVTICGTEALEVSIPAVCEAVPRIHSRLRSFNGDVSEDESRNSEFGPGTRHKLLVHLGVDSKAKHFVFEEVAYNEATFRVSDERGNNPKKQPIATDLPTCHLLKTRMPLGSILKRLESLGHPVKLSADAGRFVCNYIYYRSLEESSSSSIPALFIHVPEFEVVDKESQLAFLQDFLKTYCDSLREGEELERKAV